MTEVKQQPLDLSDAGFAFLFEEQDPDKQIDWFTVKPCASGGSNCSLASLANMLQIPVRPDITFNTMRKMIFQLYVNLGEERKELRVIGERLKPAPRGDHSLFVDDLVLLCLYKFEVIPIVILQDPSERDAHPTHESPFLNSYFATSPHYDYMDHLRRNTLLKPEGGRYVIFQNLPTVGGGRTFVAVKGRWTDQDHDTPLTGLFYEHELPRELLASFEQAQQKAVNMLVSDSDVANAFD